MRICNRTLSLKGKSSKNAALRRPPLESGSDRVLSEAAYRMMLEVRSGGLVTCVLKTSNALCLALARLCSTGKEVGFTAIVHLSGNLWFKK
jgi:hypothetical protein